MNADITRILNGHFDQPTHTEYWHHMMKKQNKPTHYQEEKLTKIIKKIIQKRG